MESVKSTDYFRVSHKRSISGPYKLTSSTLFDKATVSSSSNLLKNLKKRNKIEIDVVNPHLAARVIKDYLVPLFNHKTSSYKLGKSHISEKFIIIENLQSDNERLKSEMEKLKDKYFGFDQEKFQLQSEIKYLKALLPDLQANMEYINFNSIQLVKHNNRLEKQLEFGTFYKTNFDLTKTECIEKNHILSEQLHEENSKNYIRFHLCIPLTLQIVCKLKITN